MSGGAASVVSALKGAGWPFRNLYGFATAEPNGNGMKRDTAGKYSGGPLRPYHDRLSDYVAVQAGQLPKILLAIAVFFYTVDMDAAASGWDFSPSGWVAKVVLRDLGLMVLVAFGWDYILYFSPLKERLAPYKLNKDYPGWDQFSRDAFWTLSATLLASAQEVLLYRWWAGGHFTAAPFGSAPDELTVPYSGFFGTAANAVYSTPSLPLVGVVHFHAYTLGFVLWIVTMLYWRIFHVRCQKRGL